MPRLSPDLIDLLTRAEELLSAAVTVDDDGDVTAVALPLASQAIELVLAIGGDIAGLLQTQRWSYDPQLILSLAADGEELDRECRIHAVWCARRALAGMPTMQRRVALGVLIVALRHARGRATDADLTAARYAARDAARDSWPCAAGTAARDAAYFIAGYAARIAAGYAARYAAGTATRIAARAAARAAARDAQQTRLVNRVVSLKRKPTRRF